MLSYATRHESAVGFVCFMILTNLSNIESSKLIAQVWSIRFPTPHVNFELKAKPDLSLFNSLLKAENKFPNNDAVAGKEDWHKFYPELHSDLKY